MTKKGMILDERLCKAAVDAALSAVKVDDMLVSLHGQRKRHLRFARNGVTTAGDIDEVTGSITCVVGTKHATVQVKDLDQRTLRDAAIRAKQSAELCPDDPELVPFPGAAKVRPVPAAFVEKTALLTAQQIADAVHPAIAEAKSRNLQAAGFLELSTATSAVATKAGFFATHAATHADFSMTARTPDGTGSGWAGRAGESLAELNIGKLGLTACDKAERSRSPRGLAPGHYPVVLEAAATQELFDQMGGFFDQRAADEGASPFSAADGKTKIGESLFGQLTVYADPFDKATPSAPFDGEGTPRQRQVYVENGVLKSLHVSRYWAKKTGKQATAAPGALVARGASVDGDLVKGLDRGLLITRLWYCNVVDPKTMTLTGLTRDGVFWVEGGHIVDSVNNFRFNQSLLSLFANTEAYGPSDRLNGMMPSLRCSEFFMSTRSDAV